MKKMLIGLDDSKAAMRAVEYAGQQFGGNGHVEGLCERDCHRRRALKTRVRILGNAFENDLG